MPAANGTCPQCLEELVNCSSTPDNPGGEELGLQAISGIGCQHGASSGILQPDHGHSGACRDEADSDEAHGIEAPRLMAPQGGACNDESHHTGGDRGGSNPSEANHRFNPSHRHGRTQYVVQNRPGSRRTVAFDHSGYHRAGYPHSLVPYYLGLSRGQHFRSNRTPRRYRQVRLLQRLPCYLRISDGGRRHGLTFVPDDAGGPQTGVASHGVRRSHVDENGDNTEQAARAQEIFDLAQETFELAREMWNGTVDR